MRFKQLLTDDDAVSPVIGVILMVAITVILAAVIGTFVLGIGQDQQTTPSASFDFNWDGTTLTVTHTGGDSFTSENTNRLTVNSAGSTVQCWGSCSGVSVSWNGGTALSLPVNAGSSASGSSGVSAGNTVRVIWTGPGGGKTQTVASFDIAN